MASFRICFLIWTILFICALPSDVVTKRFGGSSNRGHSYPHSGGLSGTGGRGYPSSSGSHGYPSSQSNSHSYPASPGLSGSNSGHSYPQGGGLSGSNTGHSYPQGNSLSGKGSGHSYPSSNGLSGTGGGRSNYHYSPPQQISYTPQHGAPAHHYPVYQGPPPVYVQQIKNSNSKYGELLTGLALLNLGVAGASLYHSVGHSSSSNSAPAAHPSSVCTFRVQEGSNVEVTKIPCDIISSITQNETLLDKTESKNVSQVITNSTTPAISTEQPTNVTLIEAVGDTSNTTLNETTTLPSLEQTNITNIENATAESTQLNATEVKDALAVEGPKVEVKDTTKCSVTMKSPDKYLHREVDCKLLLAYSKQSFKASASTVSRASNNNYAIVGLITIMLLLTV